MVDLLHAMAFMVLLLIGWVIWNNKPLPLPILVCVTGSSSPFKIYLETGHLIENFVCDWYLTTNMLKLGDRLKCYYLTSEAFLSFFSWSTLKIFRNTVCVYALLLFLAIFWGRDCIHSWNVNDKYCIAITPVEQSLHPVDLPGDRNSIAYSYVHIVLALRLAGVTVGYYLSIFAFMFSATVVGVSQPRSNVAREIRNSQEPQSY